MYTEDQEGTFGSKSEQTPLDIRFNAALTLCCQLPYISSLMHESYVLQWREMSYEFGVHLLTNLLSVVCYETFYR